MDTRLDCWAEMTENERDWWTREATAFLSAIVAEVSNV